MRISATILTLLLALCSRGQITQTFFGNHIGGPLESSFVWPTTAGGQPYSMKNIRLWDVFGCNPSVCNSGNGFSYAHASNYLKWNGINTANNVYDWGLFDLVIDKCKANGVTELVYTFGNTPAWCAVGGVSNNTTPPTDTAYLGKFVRAIAWRAVAKGLAITNWEIWNEPEDGWNGKWAELVKMGQCVYENIKGINEDWKVLSPCAQGSGADFWFSQYLAANVNAKNTFDVVAFHSYINYRNAARAAYEKPEALIDAMRAVMTTYGIQAKPLWDTEGFDAFVPNCPNGDPDGCTNVENVNIQSAYLAQRYLISAAKGLERVYWYSYDQNVGRQSVSGTQNNIAVADRVVQGWMLGATVSNLTVASNVYTVDITKDGVTKKAVWARVVNSGTDTYTTTYNVGIYTQQESVYGVTTSASGAITIGTKPVLLKTPAVTGPKDYYVSNAGSDSWAGTIAAPFATVSKAENVAVKGDRIHLKKGDVFYGNPYIDPGTKDSITFDAYGTGPAPVWTGAKSIAAGSLVNEGGGIWSYTDATLPTFLNTVVLDGVYQPMGALKKNNQYFTFYTRGTNWVRDTTQTEARAGQEILIKPRNWAVGRAKVDSVVNGRIYYSTATGNKAMPYAGTTIESGFGNGYNLQNDTAFCTQVGEWAYNSSAKKLFIYFGNTLPSSLNLKVAYLSFINCDASKVTFNGINFANWNQNAVRGGGDYTKFINCEFSACGEAAIYAVDRKGWTVDGCYSHDQQSNFIKALNGGNKDSAANTGWVVQNSRSERVQLHIGLGYNGDPSGSGMVLFGRNNIIRNNIIRSVAYNGIHYEGGGNLIEKNFVDSSTLRLADGAGIYGFYDDHPPLLYPAKTIIRQNTVLNSLGNSDGIYPGTWDVTNANGKGAGIYLDEHITNVEITGNNVGRSVWCSIMLHNTQNVDVHDNTFFDSWRALYYRNFETATDELATGNKFRRNIFSNTTYRNAFGPNVLIEYSTESSNALAKPYVDSNSYFTQRPVLDSLFYTVVQGSVSYRNLSNWRTFSGGESNSTVGQKSSHYYYYNHSPESVSATLDAIYEDAAGVPNSTGLLPLSAYSSKIMFNRAVVPPPPAASAGLIIYVDRLGRVLKDRSGRALSPKR